MRVVVYHGGYGCDTGCCGHYVELQDNDGHPTVPAKFDFDHPYGKEGDELIAWVKALVEEKFGLRHTEDLDWDQCVIIDTCDMGGGGAGLNATS